LLERADIRQLPVQNLNELLAYIPGIDLRQRGPNGVQADVGIRGGSFDQTLILVNGVKMNDPQTGHHALNLMLTPDQIERIEVLKGPGTRIYGPGAFAGAINIVTRVATEREGMAAIQFGNYGLYQAQTALHIPVGNYRQSLQVSTSGSNGYRHNTDFSMGSLFYQSQLKMGKGEFYTMAGYNRRNFGANAFYASETARDQYEETATILGTVGYRFMKANLWNSDIRIYHRQHQDDYFFLRHNPGFFHNHHTTRVSGLEWNNQWNSRFGKSSVGSEWRREAIVSKNLGERERLLLGLSLDHRWLLGKLQVGAGTYFNHISDYGWRIYPGIDAAFEWRPNTLIYANVGQSFRLPTYTDLYYRSPTNIGNSQLQPEQAWTYEVGGRWLKQRFQLSAAWFLRDASRVIEWARPANGTTWQALNYVDVLFNGFEADFRWSNPAGYLKLVRLGYTGIHSNFGVVPGWESRYVLDNLRHQLTASGNVKLPLGIQGQLTARWFERQASTGQWLFDAGLTRYYRAFEARLLLSNLANVAYREVGTVVMPGRWTCLELTYRF
jgi:iron complex outermembrane receptor protein